MDALQHVATDDDSDGIAAQLPTFPSLKSSLYRSRQKKFPPLPQNREDIILEGEWSQTTTGENFLVHHGEDIIMFSTEANMRRLSTAKMLFMDGTFEVCPRLFYQIFTIHILENEKQFPMVYCLLPGKSREIYNRVFTLIKEKMQNLGTDLMPEFIMSDFELALIQSVRINFPATTHKGCYFHFRQAMWRKVQALGRQQQYNEDTEFRQLICKTAAIAFVPLQFVRPAWDGIKDELDTIDEDFCEYFRKTWMRGQFPLAMWNYFSYDGPRTNNRLEGWHSKLKKIVKKPHPNIFELIDVFKREQAANEVTIIQLATGANPPPRKRKYRAIDACTTNIPEVIT